MIPYHEIIEDEISEMKRQQNFQDLQKCYEKFTFKNFKNINYRVTFMVGLESPDESIELSIERQQMFGYRSKVVVLPDCSFYLRMENEIMVWRKLYEIIEGYEKQQPSVEPQKSEDEEDFQESEHDNSSKSDPPPRKPKKKKIQQEMDESDMEKYI